MAMKLTDVAERFARENNIAPESLLIPPRGEKLGIIENVPIRIENPVGDQIDQIQIVGRERFGNSVHRLVHAYRLALALNVDTIFFPEWGFLQSEFNVGPVRFCKGQPAAAKNTLWGSFQKNSLIAHMSVSIHYSEVVKEISRGFSFTKSVVGDFVDPLTIHIRSGDVFEGNRSRNYGQPPLAFFKHIIAHGAWDGIVLVFENESNPVIAPLLKWLRERETQTEIVNAGVLSALAAVWQAKTLVLSNGSFLEAIIASSPNLEEVHLFGGRSMPRVKGLNPAVNVQVRGDRFQSYERLLMFNWQDKVWQRKLMLCLPVVMIRELRSRELTAPRIAK